MSAHGSLVGMTLAGKYLLRSLLGSGAMGAIYEGVHTSLGRRVAIKVLPKNLAGDADLVARFHREARAMSVIESDYIVQVFDVGEAPGVGLYMVLELLSGEDLEQRLQRDGRIDSETAVTIGYQVARGLAKAHAAGVVHRDLKPANIFLTTRDDGTLLAKILDFGISKLTILDGPASDGITRPGIALGTPQYMSPEQIHARASVDGRSDVWGLSVVLYEILAGTGPFAQPNYLSMLEAILDDTIPHLGDVAPWVPQTLADVVMAGLVRDVDGRTPSAAIYAQEVLYALAAPPVRASGPVLSMTPTPLPPKLARTSDADTASGAMTREIDALPPDSTLPRIAYGFGSRE